MNKRLLLIGLLIGLTIVAPVYAQGPWPTEPSNSGIHSFTECRTMHPRPRPREQW